MTKYSSWVARTLIASTDVRTLQRFAGSRRGWAPIVRGFRPDRITHSGFLRFSGLFARDQALFADLCEAFLSSAGVAKGESVSARMQAAATAPGISSELRAICEAVGAGLPLPEELPSLFDEALTESDEADTLIPPPPGSAANTAVTTSGRSARSSANRTEARTFLPVELQWEPPNDDVASAQAALTRFERVLVAFVRRQLRELHGEAWLRRGCSPYLDMWREDRANRNGAKAPDTELGLAHLHELGELICRTENWPAFQPYFERKDFVQRNVAATVALRIAADHPGERRVYLAEELEGLAAMTRLTKPFHDATASFINEILQQRLAGDPPADADSGAADLRVRERVLTNLGADYDPGPIIGRDEELGAISGFWNDTTRRVLTIVGGGGVGKTALLDGWLGALLDSRSPLMRPCNPEAVVYLSAKENYMERIHEELREPQRFSTLRRVFESTLEVLVGEAQSGRSLNALREDLFELAHHSNGAVSILFALDNLESLLDEELEELDEFLANLPASCKAIVTTRDDRRSGKRLVVSGLTFEESLELLRRHLEPFGLDELELTDGPNTRELYRLTTGVPLHLKFFANLLVDGHTVEEAIANLSGAQGLHLLEFSFGISLQTLPAAAVGAAYYLAVTPRAANRSQLMKVVGDEETYQAVHRRLTQISFVERTAEDGKQVRFKLTSPLLREHLKKRGPEILGPRESTRIRSLANVAPEVAESPKLTYEVERTLQKAVAESVGRNWSAAAAILEDARKELGDDRRLLAQLGYFYFRMERRQDAMKLLRRAIDLGHESADTYAYLALVYHYEGYADEALLRAKQAIQLRERHDLAEQIAGQALLSKASGGRFTIDDARKWALLREALGHLERSIRPSDLNWGDAAHNRRSEDLIERVKAELARLGES